MAAVAATDPLPELDERAPSGSPAGPVDPGTAVRRPPALPTSSVRQTLMFGLAPLEFNLRAYRELGDVWQINLPSRREPFVITSHPDHVRSLFPADPADVPSLTGETPLRPILGPNSVLMLTGERHMRERKLLLPPFHGEAVQRYVAMIEQVAEREIDRWPI